ncbi:MAG: MATE family efflux transporter [Oscillospiraceae bacterium]|jgi:putative MATE family efflux protein|nr:MATE family efflux transporter [Oscillospiraceae bacterium]
MNLESIKNNKLKMILQFSVPSIIAMVLTSLINIVDGIFTGNYVGSAGMSAIELGLPIVYLYLAVGLMISVGGIAIAGRLYGAGDIDKARDVFNQTMTVCTIVSAVISIAIFILMRPLVSLMGLNGEVARFFTDYYFIMLIELPIMIINSSLGMFIRGEGHPQFFMMTSILTLIINTVLDYLFAAVFQLGIRGIAFSSLLASLAALVLNLIFIRKSAKIYQFARFHFDGAVQKEMILNGSSEFIGEMTMFFSMSAYNYVILSRFGVNVLTAFTIVGFVSYIYSMVIIGFGQGIIPLVSFVFGARDRQTAIDIRRKTSFLVIGTAVVIMIIMLFVTNPYCSMFISDKSIVSMASRGILIDMIAFPFAGINCIASMYFTSIGCAKESAIISSARGLVILLIAIFVLPAIFGITGLWIVSPVTEVLTIFITVYYLGMDRKAALKSSAESL